MPSLFTALKTFARHLGSRPRLAAAPLTLLLGALSPAACATVTVQVSGGSSQMCSGTSAVFTAYGSPSGCEGTQGTASYQWQVISGGTATNVGTNSSSYNYTASGSGTVQIKCTVTYPNCGSGSDTKSVTITSAGLTVSASASPSSPTTCQQVTVTGSATQNCESGSITYTYNFGDGSALVGPTTQSSATHTYGAAGSYTATVSASDGTHSNSGTTTVTVQAASPVSSAPQNVQITGQTTSSLTLSWQAVTGATGYIVSRKNADGTYTKMTASGTSYTDSGLQPSTSYCYHVAAYNDCNGKDAQGNQQTGAASSPDTCGGTLCNHTITITQAQGSVTAQKAGLAVNFSAAATDSCAASLTYTWNFDDPGSGAQNTATGPTASHIYAAPKTDASGNVIAYSPTVTVSDGTASQSRTISTWVDGGLPRKNDPGDDDDCERCVAKLQVQGMLGDAAAEMLDPIATRGYPLSWSVQVHSQAVDMDRPTANAAFTYDMHVGRDTVYDGSCSGVQQWMVVAGNGRRLDFGPTSSAPAAQGPIFSTLTVQGPLTAPTGYTLTGAGSPDDPASAGDFSYLFDAAGHLRQITDPAGNVQTLKYDASGNLYQILDQGTNKHVDFTWTGNVITLIKDNPDAGGASLEQTALTYTSGAGYAGQRLASVTVRDGAGAQMTTRSFGYYSDGTLQSVQDDGDATTLVTLAYTPHSSTNCTTPVLMANASSSQGGSQFSWGRMPAAGAADSVYDKNVNNGVTEYDYDTAGNLIRTVLPIPNGAAAAPTLTSTYDAGGKRELISSSDGAATETFGYTAAGLVNDVKDGLNNEWKTTYDTSGVDVKTTQDPVQSAAGVSSSVTYGDPAHPHVPTAATDADGNTWTFGLNASGQVTTVTPPSGSPMGAATTTYDETTGSATLGYAKKLTDGNLDIITLDSYDALGDLTSVSTYPVNGSTSTKNTTLLQYDGLQRLTKVTHPDGKSIQNVYVGRHLDHTTDEAAISYYYTYCGCGALTGIQGPTLSGLGQWALGWSYDIDHELTSFTDANSHSTLYTYGQADELKQVTYPDNTKEQYSYDNYGRVAQVTNGLGHRVQYGYDGAERVHTITFPDGGAGANAHPITLDYNTDGSVHDTIDGAGTTTYAYSPGGRLLSVIYDFTASGMSSPQELDYDYFADGLRRSLTWKSGAATVASWAYGYDPGGRLTSVTNSFNEKTTFTYDGQGELTGQSNANTTSTAWGYNTQRGWVRYLNQAKGGTNFAAFQMTYDGGSNTVGNLTGVSESGPSPASLSYTYDQLNRLTSEARGTGASPVTHTYGYDLAGNVTSVDGSARTFDAGNKQSGMSYDTAGDLTSGGVGAYTWGDRGEVVSRTASGVSPTTYVYGAGGLRVRAAPYGQSPVYYVFDGETLVGEVTGAGTPAAPSAGTASAAYTWGAGGLVSERLLSGTARSLWYHFGPQGETRWLTDAAGNVADSYKYTAYGVPTASTGTDANPFRYGGQVGYYTEAAFTGGAVLCGHRWYDPNLQRWLSRDPIGYEGGDNLYAYCDGDPISENDLSGLIQKVTTNPPPSLLQTALQKLWQWLNEPLPGTGGPFRKGQPVPLPHGFKDQKSFDNFARMLNDGIRKAGHGGAQPVFTGSSVTGRKFMPGDDPWNPTGRPFCSESDYDIALAGPDILNAAKGKGIKLRGGGTRTGPLSELDLKELGLYDLQQQLSKQAGREVNFMIYKNLTELSKRGPGIVVFPGRIP